MFQVGDVVKLRGCNGHQRVTHVNEWNGVISTSYLKSDHGYYDRRASDFELINQPKPRPMEDQPMNTSQLFKVTETGKFGTFLTEDGDGKFVLQMAEGGYEAYLEKNLEKVCPYTIQVDFAAGGGGHFKVSKEHKLVVGDAVTIGRNFGMVKKLDTRRDNAQVPENLRKIVTEAIA